MEIKRFAMKKDHYEIKYDLENRSIVAKISDEPKAELSAMIPMFKEAALTVLDLLNDKSAFVVTAVEFFTTDGDDGLKVTVERNMQNGYSHSITSPVAYCAEEEGLVSLPANTQQLIHDFKLKVVEFINGSTAQKELFE